MNLGEKINLLQNEGQWDLSSEPLLSKNAAGDIVYSTSGSGLRLFKTLMDNSCTLDCSYCQNSTHCRKPHISYTPEELAKVFTYFQLNGMVDSLFLSSAVCVNADETMEKMIEAVRIIRERYRFRGYIHMKVLPGASKDAIGQASQYADRLSINIEAPNQNRLDELTSVKDFSNDLLKRQQWIRDFKPKAGQSTQMIVGAGSETDLEIFKTAEWEYGNMSLQRVYYSGFTPIKGTPLEDREKTPEDRERRLYCVDYMMRNYGIDLNEFKPIFEEGNLHRGDPKIHLALKQLDKPVDVNQAEFEELIRVPGIGPISAYRILASRGMKEIKSRSHLNSLGVVVKRAEPFVKINGRIQKKMTEYLKDETVH